MSMEDLKDFCRLYRGGGSGVPAVLARINDGENMMEIANDEGYNFTTSELRVYLEELNGGMRISDRQIERSPHYGIYIKDKPMPRMQKCWLYMMYEGKLPRSL